MAENEFPTEYDEIVLGTGLQESILAAALARIGHRVLHLDRNDYYSGDWASFNLNGLLQWVEKNQNDNSTEQSDASPTLNEANDLLQDGETLVELPHNPRTAFDIQVKCYIKEGDLEAIRERPIVFPPYVPVPEAVVDPPPPEDPSESQEGAEAPSVEGADTPSGERAEAPSSEGAEAPSVEAKQAECPKGSSRDAEEQRLTEECTDNQDVKGQELESQSLDESPSSGVAAQASGSVARSADGEENDDGERTSEQGATNVPPTNADNTEHRRSQDNTDGAADDTEGQAEVHRSSEGQGSSSSDQGASGGQQDGHDEVQAGAGAADGAEAGQSETAARRREWTWADLKSQWRKFNVDLAPKLMFCRGSMVELLVSSRISRYAEFKAVTRILTHINGQLEQVPCSRADVFSSKYVGMLEKRMLMRLIEFCLNHQNRQDEYEAYKERPFVEFLKSRRLTPTLQHFVIHSIAMVNADTPTEEALVSMQYFLRSLGRYGNTAFLWTLYGSGELPQCFCRMCAVFAGIYMLRSLPRGLIVDNSQNVYKGIIDEEGRRLTCNHIVMEHSYVPPRASSNSLGSVSRGVLITDRSLKPTEYDEVTLLTVPPPDGSSKPVRVIELNWASNACPKDLFLVHLTCISVNGATNDLQYALEQLFQPLNEDEGDPNSDKPKVLWSLFFNQVDATGCDDAVLAEGLPANALVTAGPGASVGFEHAVSQARRLFERICPGEEFLPPAPDPEDIIYEDAARDNPGEHKEVGFEIPENDTKSSDETPEDGTQATTTPTDEQSTASDKCEDLSTKPEMEEKKEDEKKEAATDIKAEAKEETSQTTS